MKMYLLFGLLLGAFSTLAQGPILPDFSVDGKVKNVNAYVNEETFPASFIENKGQWPRNVLFCANLNGTTVWVTNDGIVYDFYKTENITDCKKNTSPLLKEQMNTFKKSFITGHVVKMKFAEKNGNQEVIGHIRQKEYFNYFIGNDSSKWSSNVGSFKEVLIKNLYENIDARLYFDKGSLRYDLIVAPFANLQQIRFYFEGQENISVNDAGDLILKTCLGNVEQKQIYAYQEINGKKKQIGCSFSLPGLFASFDVKNHDPSKSIVIDPLVYSTFLGGSGSDGAYQLIKRDVSGNIYVCGETHSSNFPVTTGAYQITNNSSAVFITKLNSQLSGLIYSTFIGGNSSYEYPDDMDIDSNGNVYLTGVTNASNFPTTAGVLQPAYAGGWGGGYDGFVTKLNQYGNALIYSTYIGGSQSNDWGVSIAVDATGIVYLTGVTNSNDFPVTPGALQITKPGGNLLDLAYVSKINPNGTALIYSTFLGGTGGSAGYGIAINSVGMAFIAGCARADFPVTSGSFDQSFNGGNYDCFLSLLDFSGSNLLYSTYIGGSNEETLSKNAISLDNYGHVYIAGNTNSLNFPISTGSFQTINRGGFDTFILKLNPSSAGSADLLYSTYLGGSGDDFSGNSLDLDASGNLFLSGTTTSSDFPITPGALQTTKDGGQDVFFTKLNASASGLLYSTYIGGSAEDSSPSEAALGNSAYVTGSTGSANFPITPGAFDETYNGGSSDVFVSKLDLRSIITGVLPATSICAGMIISVPFIASDTFNSANVFTAQLSDASGSFASPVNIGTIPSNMSGTINAIIPPNTLAGSGFRIRIISSSPIVTGTNNGIDFAVYQCPGTPCPGMPPITYEGKNYNTVQIGQQCWLKENLNVGTRINGSQEQTNNSTIEKYCYNDLESNCDVYGGLYQWNELMNYTPSSNANPSGRQGICPTDWHIPSDAEYCLMESFLDGTVNCSINGWVGTDVGGKMKEVGSIHWSSPNTGATNSSGFSGFGGGYRDIIAGGFINLSITTGFWSSTEGSSATAWYQVLAYSNALIGRDDFDVKTYGFSSRCVKNCLPPNAPTDATPIPAPTQIIWNWTAVPNVIGYKWNATNDYSTATDMGLITTKTETDLTCNTAYTRFVWAYNGCGFSPADTLTQTTSACFTCGSSITINHVAGIVAPVTKTTTYGTVTNISGEPSKCWITSNLGSDHQASSVDDATEASAGWYWQFNKKQGYKHDGTNRTPNTAWINNFSDNSDWLTENDPCTIELGNGWRIPTNTEWINIDATGNWSNWNSAWNSELKLHAAGSLHYSGGFIYNRGSVGSCWSSTQGIASTYGKGLGFDNVNSDIINYNKAWGFTIRCINDCASPGEPTNGTHVAVPTQIIWNWTPVANATGYKWNTTNNFATAIDMGTATTKTETGLTCNNVYTRYIWAYNACGNSTVLIVIQSTSACFTCGSSLTINHVTGTVAPVTKTTTYGTVTNIPGETSKCWITSNLGADHQATAVNDATEASAGWYWQFNHKQGFKNDGVTLTPTVMLGGFQEQSDWVASNDPCSIELGSAWRIPSYTEWNNVNNTGGWTSWIDPWNSGLKMHAAGWLAFTYGQLVSRGTEGDYWTSTQFSSVYGLTYWFYSSYSHVDYSSKNGGFPLRCILEICSSSPTAPGSGTHIPSPVQIIWNWNPVPGATGYKWNTTDDYATAIDMGIATTKTETGLTCNTAYTRYIWAYNACGNSTVLAVIQATSACFTCGSSLTINHVAGVVAPVNKTVTYGTVNNIPGEPIKCWITSNLGADHQATSVDDPTEASAGWYWQFNKKQGYKHDGSIRTPNTDWIASINENSDWLTINDPCSIELGNGWRIPTITEWTNVDASGNWTTWNGPWNSGLKIHGAGFLSTTSGQLLHRGLYGDYWASMQDNATLGMTLYISSQWSDVPNNPKQYGVTIRCINDCASPNIPVNGTHTSTPSQIIWNWTAVNGAIGYKWNTTNDYATAIDMGNSTTKTEIGLTCNTVYTRYVWAYNACGNSAALNLNQSTSACFTCGSSLIINHVTGEVAPVTKTTTYGTVTNISGEPSKCWITSNLGSDHQATAVNDATEASAGWYWQFNRMQGYQNDGTARTPSTAWISSNSENSDWLTANDPCKIELGTTWHIPTYTEWYNVDNTGGWTNWNGPWGSGLKLHDAGFLGYSDGSLGGRGSYGYYWSSTQYDATNGWYLVFNYGGSFVGSSSKAFGFSLRCLREPCSSAPSPPTSGTNTASPNQIIWSWIPVTDATGYKWNTTNDYSTATEMGPATTKTEIGLTCNTAYTRYVWAYNACGNSAPFTLSQSTSACSFTCGSSFTDARDNQVYTTVLIGTQCWMKENLNVGTKIPGSQDQTNNSTIEKYCYNNDDANCDVYGGLYQWDELMNYTTSSNSNPSGRQGICPTEWHVPSDGEWCQMETYLDASVNCISAGWLGTDVGGKLKETGTNYWASPNTGANNSSGFSALPGGYRNSGGNFLVLTISANFWSALESSTMDAWYYSPYYSSAQLSRSDYGKLNGFSTRCIMNLCSFVPIAPSTGTNMTSPTQIIWKWTTVMGAIGYKWNTTNNFATAIDLDTATTKTETDLTCNTPYTRYIWAYNGCGYSTALTLIQSTSACIFTCGQPITDSRDNKTYNTVQIGDQCWMKENLNVGTKISGSLEQTNNNTIEKYCYNNDTANCAVYGGLYQWDELINYTTSSNSNPSGRQGICPTEWHVPSDAEWCQMETYLDATVNCTNTGWLGTNVGGKLKETGTNHWASPNAGATNSSGFTALPGAYRINTGSFEMLNYNAYFWVTEEVSISNALLRYLDNSETHIARYDIDKHFGFSTRCVKDCAPPISPTTGSHVFTPTQIIWNWTTVPSASGYKWNTTNDFISATDMGALTTKTETGLTCNTPYTRYVWAYNGCGHSASTPLYQTTSNNQPVSITILSSATSVCAETPVMFTATPVNGGAFPIIQWKVNGENVDTNNLTYSYTPLNNDIVTCVLTSDLLCTIGNPATSNSITVTVNPRPVIPVSLGDQIGCSINLPGTLSVTAPGGSTVDWYNSAVGGELLQTNSTTYSTSTAGTYYAESRDVATGCKSTSRTPITLTINQAVQYFADVDGDGYGNPAVSVFSCSQVPGYVTNNADCNDNNPLVYPNSQHFAFTGNPGFASSIVFPLTGTPYTTFNFEGDYFDISNALPSPGFPKLILDYEGNGSFTDPNDRVIIMTPYDQSDLNTSDGKRYIANLNGLPYGSNWKTRIVVSDGGNCATTFGPFDYPDILQQPNLSIFANDITLSNNHPDISQNITVSAVIHNESDYPAQNFLARLVNQFDTNIIYPDITVSNILPHANMNVSWSIMTPSIPAWCPMQVKVDYSNVIAETNELDNSAVRPFVNGNYRVAGKIVCTSSVSPTVSNSSPGNYLTLSGRAVYDSLTVPLPDPSVAGATVEFQITETGAVSSGYTNSSGYYSIHFLAPVPSGIYHITGTITDYTLTGTFSTTFTITIPQPQPNTNLTLSGCRSLEVQPANPQYQGSATLVANVNNSGNQVIPGPIQVQFTYSTGGSFQGEYPGNLNPGQTVAVTANAPLPLPATTTLTAVADPANLINESNESDNTASDNMCVDFQPVPNCWGNFWDHTYNVNQSTGLSVGLIVSHLYDVGPVKVKFEVSGPGITGTQDLGIGTLNYVTRNCSGCPYTISIPAYTFTNLGTYTFTMTADPYNEYTECYENNNVLVVPVNVIPPVYIVHKPNLTFVSCHSLDVHPATSYNSGMATLVANIVNNGDTIAKGPIQVKFAYSSGEIFNGEYNGNLAPGQSAAVTVSAELPPPATTVLSAVIDPLNHIQESNESDNTTLDDMCWDFQPVPYSPYCGSNFWSHNYVVNQSTPIYVGLFASHLYDAITVKVKFEVSGPGIPGNLILGTGILNNVSRNCYSCPYGVSLPYAFTFTNVGTYTFTMTADPDNEYTECNENNNVLVVSVDVTEFSDMRLLSQYINPDPLNPSPNQPVSLLVTYDNVGFSNVNDSMKMKVLVDNIQLASIDTIHGLASGDHATVSIPTTWSSNLSGAHVIRAIIDADNHVVESNKTNNEATRLLVVGQAANLYFQSFTPSNSTPNLNDKILLNARIGNNGAENCNATVQFFYISNSNDTIPIGQTSISIQNHDSVLVTMPWIVTDDATTLIGKIANTSVLEFNYDDNMATTIIGGFNVSVVSSPACTGGLNGYLVASANGGVAPYMYIWNTGHIGDTLHAGAGNYTVTVHDNTGLTRSGSGTITVTSPPVPHISGPISVCQGSTGNSYSTETGMTNYLWTVSAGGTITTGAGTNVITVTWHTAGAQSVSVNYNNAFGCAAVNATAQPITVHSLPVPTLTGPTIVCANITSCFYKTDAGKTNYEWLKVGNWRSIAGGSSTDSTIRLAWTEVSTPTISVNYTDANGCTGANPPVLHVVSVTTPGDAGDISGPIQVNQGQSGVVYSVDSISSAYGYAWTLPQGATIVSGANTKSIIVTFSSSAVSGNISVHGTNICGNGPEYDNLFVKVIPKDLEQPGYTVANGQTKCYNAWQTITIPGDGTSFTIQTGGSATMIAGQNIKYLPVTTVNPGGYLHGSITNNGQYCTNQKLSLPANPADMLTTSVDTIMGSSQSDFGCYPNPTPGKFTLWLLKEPNKTPVKVTIYNLLGVEFISKLLYSGKLHELSLENHPEGIYLVKVVQNGKVGIIKVVRH